MFDWCFAFVAFLLCSGIGVLAVLLLQRTNEINRLRERIEDVEDDCADLRKRIHRLAPRTEEPASQSTPITLPAEPSVEPILAEAVPAPRERRERDDLFNLENWLGQRALGWAAVVLLFLATAFFLQYAFDNDWIGELGQVSLGILAGAGLCLGGFFAHRHQRRLGGQMLTAAGIVLLYLSTFSSFGFYHLIPQDRAVVYLVVLVASSATLALLYDAQAIAIVALLGGLATPLLMHSDRDQYVNLFVYLSLLEVGVVAIALFRDWRVLPVLGFTGTQCLFWLWYGERYHPEKMAAALSFQGVIYLLFLVHDVFVPWWRGRTAHVIDLGLIVVNACSFAVAGYVLLELDHATWRAPLAVVLALGYTLMTWAESRSPNADIRLAATLIATGASFLAFAIGLRAEAAWISLGWAVQGLALWWFGCRVRNPLLRVMALAFLLLAVGRLIVLDTPWTGRAEFWLLLNRYCLPGLAVAGCALAACLVSRRLLPEAPVQQQQVASLLGLAGGFLAWLVLSVDVYQFFRSFDFDGSRLGQMSLSVFWALLAAVSLGVGFRIGSSLVRRMALGLFALTLAKVVLIDMADLPGIYRVAAFFALAVMMGVGARAYQRLSSTAQLRSPKGVKS